MIKKIIYAKFIFVHIVIEFMSSSSNILYISYMFIRAHSCIYSCHYFGKLNLIKYLFSLILVEIYKLLSNKLHATLVPSLKFHKVLFVNL